MVCKTDALTCVAIVLLHQYQTVAVIEKNIWGAWALIIWEATTAKRNCYRTKKLRKKLFFFGGGQDLGPVPPGPT